MSKPKFCHTCTFYEKNIFTRTSESFGICHNVAVATKLAVDGGTVLGENGSIYTEEYFGCVYWRENNGVLIDTSKLVKDKLSDRIQKAANELIDEFLPKEEFVICSVCGAENCENNVTCIKCNCQL